VRFGGEEKDNNSTNAAVKEVLKNVGCEIQVELNLDIELLFLQDVPTDLGGRTLFDCAKQLHR